MRVINRFAVNNPCYKNDQKIIPRGVMIHSIGVPQPNPEVIAANFNQTSADSCVHAVIGTGEEVYQLLPWDHRAWHCGSGPNGSANGTHISFEMTEPSTIRYTQGAVWTDLNPEATGTHVMQTYRRAVTLTAWICSENGLDPLRDGVLLSHTEGHARGVASNHADVEHLWDKFGLSMRQFRKDVASAITGEGDEQEEIPENPSDDEIKYYVQAGAFAVRENAQKHVEELKKAGFEAYIKEK